MNVNQLPESFLALLHSEDLAMKRKMLVALHNNILDLEKLATVHTSTLTRDEALELVEFDPNFVAPSENGTLISTLSKEADTLGLKESDASNNKIVTAWKEGT